MNIEDLSKCQCEAPGFCPIFNKEMGTAPPNWQWCQSSTPDRRKEYQSKGTFKDLRGIRRVAEAGQVSVCQFRDDDLPTPKSDYAICVIPANSGAMDLLEITRDSIQSYAKKCKADYVELTGDQHPDWVMANKYRLHKVSKEYKKTLYLDCDVFVKQGSPNIFNATPDDRISAFDEWSIWEDKEDTIWIERQQDVIVHKVLKPEEESKLLNNGKFTTSSMLNGGVLVIPQVLADYYQQPDENYPRHWCFDQNYLTLKLPTDKLYKLSMKYNTPLILGPKFGEAAEEAYFVHINNMSGEREAPQRKRMLSSFVPKTEELKFNTCLFEGFDSHRSGWKYAISKLVEDHHSYGGILIDDFIERSHSWSYADNAKKGIIPYKEDWIGFIHNPFLIPEFFYGCHSVQSIFQRSLFRESLKTCKAMVTFSESNVTSIKNYFGSQIDFPVFSLKHPSETPDTKWNPDLFLEGKRQLVLLGYWLRKITQFCFLKTDYEKIWLRGDKRAADACWLEEKAFYQRLNRDSDILRKEFIDHFGHGEWGRPKNLDAPFENLQIPDYLPNDEYDKLLSSAVVYLNFYDTVANNAVIECIARNTPVVVYKHPSVVEYLGVDYPLYFTTVEQAESILQDNDLILRSHEYLKTMNKDWLCVDYFTQDFIRKASDITKRYRKK
jgi:hypothetical protein